MAVNHLIQNKGPFVTEVPCMSDEKECPQKSKLIANEDTYPMTWTPNNELAILNPVDREILIFNVETRVLRKTFTIPETNYAIASFVWSPDEEWFVLGAGMGPGIYFNVN